MYDQKCGASKIYNFYKIPESNSWAMETVICILLSGIVWLRPSAVSFIEFLNKRTENVVKNLWSCGNKKLLGFSNKF